MQALTEGMLCVLGNPLLDISANTGTDLLEKYELKANDAILAADKHLPIYKELEEKYNADYFLGGSALNSAMIAQNVLKTPSLITYMGSIGNDPYGKILEKKAEEVGLNVQFQKHESTPTGTCAVVITEEGKCRSLCANLAAANLFSEDHLENPEIKSLIAKAKYFYISGFFLTVSPKSIMKVAKHASENNKLLFMNLSAEFITTVFKDPMMEVFPFVDFVFGNEAEAKAFASIHKLGSTCIKDIAAKIAEQTYNKQGSRTVIITQGPDPVILIQNGVAKEFPVTKIPDQSIVDTNGAGDAFVGGFLSQFLLQKPIEKCIQCGIWASSLVIQKSGCRLPTDSVFNL